MEKALILFSGGKDSLFATLQYLEKSYEVYLVHYDNGCCISLKNIHHGISRLQKKYSNRVHFLGTKKISPYFRTFTSLYFNLTPTTILKKYGEIPTSQFICLACRLSMYIESILLCKQYKIQIVVDGARNSQLFAIEQNLLLNSFQCFFKNYNLSLDFPLKDWQDDFELKNQLLSRGFVPKVLEPQCLLGTPLKEKEMNDCIVQAVNKVFHKLLKLKAIELVEQYANVERDSNYI